MRLRSFLWFPPFFVVGLILYRKNQAKACRQSIKFWNATSTATSCELNSQDIGKYWKQLYSVDLMRLRLRYRTISYLLATGLAPLSNDLACTSLHLTSAIPTVTRFNTYYRDMFLCHKGCVIVFVEVLNMVLFFLKPHLLPIPIP